MVERGRGKGGGQRKGRAKEDRRWELRCGRDNGDGVYN